MRDDTIKPLGSYCGFEQLETDRTYPNVLYQYVRYEHLGLKIRYAIINRKIHGLWLGYYNKNNFMAKLKVMLHSKSLPQVYLF